MSFVWQNRRVVLVGDHSLRRTKAMLREIRMEGGVVLIECNERNKIRNLLEGNHRLLPKSLSFHS